MGVCVAVGSRREHEGNAQGRGRELLMIREGFVLGCCVLVE